MATTPESRARVVDEDDLYPETDGKPMGEGAWHWDVMTYLSGALREHFRERPDVLIACDMFIYYQEGDPKKRRAPDCMVAFGVGNHARPCFKTWAEPAAPVAVVEVVSKRTYRADLTAKAELYASLGVEEYYLFDNRGPGKVMEPPFRAFRLREGRYEEIRSDPDGGLDSPVLGVRFVPEGPLLRMIDSLTGLPYLSNEEKTDALEEKTRRADEEARRAAEGARHAAEEARRADSLAAEVERLKALLAKGGGAGTP